MLRILAPRGAPSHRCSDGGRQGTERDSWFAELYFQVTGWETTVEHTCGASSSWSKLGRRYVAPETGNYVFPNRPPMVLEKDTPGVLVAPFRMLVAGGPHAGETIVSNPILWHEDGEPDAETRDYERAMEDAESSGLFAEDPTRVSNIPMRDARRTNLDTTLALFAKHRRDWQPCPPESSWRLPWWYKLAGTLGTCSGLVPSPAPPDAPVVAIAPRGPHRFRR